MAAKRRGTPPKALRSIARESNREVVQALHAEIAANRRMARELAGLLRDHRATNNEMLEILRLLRVDLSRAALTPEVISQIVKQAVVSALEQVAASTTAGKAAA